MPRVLHNLTDPIFRKPPERPIPGKPMPHNAIGPSSSKSGLRGKICKNLANKKPRRAKGKWS
jgi:hypothetical protein